MLKNPVKHSKRYQQIVNAFLKNGFSHFLFRIGLTDRAFQKEHQQDDNINLQDVGKKLKETLQTLGPTFIKLGQIASSRRDLVPKAVADELEKLHDEVSAFSYEEVKSIIQTELGEPVEETFATFTEEPLATASIGQVHTATLFTGEEVAVKIQRPNIKAKVAVDLEIVRDLARIAHSRMEWARTYHIRDMMEELSASLQEELDYYREGSNGERIREQFSENPNIVVPKIFWNYTTKKVLTMEQIKGIKVSHIECLEKEGYDCTLLADRIANAMLSQVLEHGFFHGDPHAGNIFILPHHRVAFVDFGMTGHLIGDMRENFTSLLMNVRQTDAKGMIKTFSRMDLLDDVENIPALERELNILLEKYYNTSLEQLNLGSIILEIFNIAYQHHVDIPKDVAIIGKAIITMEDIIKPLDPSFSIMDAVEPFGEKLLKRRYHPKRVAERFASEVTENIELLKDLPADFKQISTIIKKGKLQFEMNVKELHAFQKRLDKISNRLSFSIILLSFSILMASLIIGAAISGHTTLIWRLPVIEIGSVIATLMFLFMIFTIIRSGRM